MTKNIDPDETAWHEGSIKIEVVKQHGTDGDRTQAINFGHVKIGFGQRGRLP
jgi:hypothetical protein